MINRKGRRRGPKYSYFMPLEDLCMDKFRKLLVTSLDWRLQKLNPWLTDSPPSSYRNGKV